MHADAQNNNIFMERRKKEGRLNPPADICRPPYTECHAINFLMKHHFTGTELQQTRHHINANWKARQMSLWTYDIATGCSEPRIHSWLKFVFACRLIGTRESKQLNGSVWATRVKLVQVKRDLINQRGRALENTHLKAFTFSVSDVPHKRLSPVIFFKVTADELAN